MSEITIGDRVEFVDESAHKIYPTVYPECGTIGTVTDVDKIGIFKVQWPTGTTSYDGLWYANQEKLRKVEK